MKIKRKTIGAWGCRVIIWIAILLALFPIVAVISASMAKGQGFTQETFFPKIWTLDNYIRVLTKTRFLIWVKNSLIICTSCAVLQLLLATPAAFAFSKLKFRGRKNGLMVLLILQMFPAVMSLAAILSIAYKIGFMDKLWAVVLILSAGSAYNIWLLKGFMDGIPNELVEAAYVDGANTFQTFIKIILPLSRNMIIVIFLFAFIGVYSEFLFSAALLKNPFNQTVTTGMKQFITNNFSTNWTQYSAAAIMASVPVTVIFMALQKFIASGLVAGSVKE